MIRSNLSILLAEKNLKITRVAYDTGISRTTLTALCQNDCKGIQFDTLNTLCGYLNVSTSDIIQHYPIDLMFECTFYDFREILPDVEGEIEVTYFNKFNLVGLQTIFKIYIESGCLDTGRENIDIYTVIISKKEDTKDSNKIIKMIKEMPKTFLSDIEKKLSVKIYNTCHSVESEYENCDFSFKWFANDNLN